ncbi:ABC transporter permease [Aquimarina sp. 2201CG5-10]|uniref:ABC transporter permease n=1 Tax=Aquimarina callyspongiae TaxID=3098150 RepID=UPI002AB445BE|nr:ABC transporter permease [Aquimarina sp. 2201CG5-10]MDY8137529.1 FtsX-like permease family protein [Aquimarina sp. 2201CG5-10]
MIRNYIKIAWRNLLKNKMFSFINIFGLSIGLATCFLLLLYVFNELSYDKHHKDVNSIYRIALETKDEKWAATPAPVAQALKTDFNEIEEVTRVLNFPTVDRLLLKNEKDDTQFYETNGYYADASFFKVFTYNFKFGDSNTALEKPNTVVISESIATKMFGDQNPIDKTISIGIPYGTFDYTIKGVFKDVYKSHVNPNLVLSMQNGDLGQWVKNQTNWANNNIFYTYLKFKKDTKLPSFTQKIPAFLDRNGGADLETINTSKSLFLQPIKDIYLKSSIGNEISSNGSMKYIYIFSSIAAFLLLIACINFMNLSTARSEKRAKEVGVRKVMGANKKTLIMQFLGESLLMCFIALTIALLIILLFLPVFNALTQKELDLFQNPMLIYWIIGLTIITGLLSGMYPAFYLSSFKPITVLKGKLINSISASSIRKGLVVFQFTISVSLILVAIVIWKQMNYLQNQDLGFKKDQQIIVPFRNPNVVKNYDALKNEILKNPKIASVSAGTTYPGFQLVQDKLFYSEGKTMEDKVDIHFAQVYDDYIETLGYKLLQGRSFTTQFPANNNSIILNETAVAQLGYTTENAVGKKIYYEYEQERFDMEIVGVVKDFNYQSLHQAITPYGIVRLEQEQPNYLIANVKEGDFTTIVAGINTIWNKINSGTPFEFSFLDQDFQRNYNREKRTSDIITYFTAITVFIACLGLLGLASFSTEQRRKEVGIRRVLGASITSITALLSKDFLKLVIIAILIACPISYYLGYTWLQDFAYRININWWLFLAGGIIAICVALATVSFQVIKTAIISPVRSLRTE